MFPIFRRRRALAPRLALESLETRLSPAGLSLAESVLHAPLAAAIVQNAVAPDVGSAAAKFADLLDALRPPEGLDAAKPLAAHPWDDASAEPGLPVTHGPHGDPGAAQNLPSRKGEAAAYDEETGELVDSHSETNAAGHVVYYTSRGNEDHVTFTVHEFDRSNRVIRMERAHFDLEHPENDYLEVYDAATGEHNVWFIEDDGAGPDELPRDDTSTAGWRGLVPPRDKQPSTPNGPLVSPAAAHDAVLIEFGRTQSPLAIKAWVVREAEESQGGSSQPNDPTRFVQPPVNGGRIGPGVMVNPPDGATGAGGLVRPIGGDR